MQLCHSVCDNNEFMQHHYNIQRMQKGNWDYRWSGSSPYNQEGVKYCPTCNKFMQILGNNPDRIMLCPCCKSKLRTRPRNRSKAVKAMLKRIS